MTGLVQFAREHLGLDLWPGQLDVLTRWEASGRKRAVLRLGRRSGKDLIGAVAAIKNATVDDYSGLLRPGEQRFIFVVATREQQAREFVRVVRELLAAAPDSDLRALVDERASGTDEIVFRTGVTLRALPCSSRAGRGYAVSLVVANEAAHFVSETDGYQAFREVWRSLVPATAQFGAQGYVLTLSTPRWPSGWFYTLCEQGESGADVDLFHIHRPTWEMNPAITRASLEGEFIADPEGAEAEYGASFVSGLGAFLDPLEVWACVVKGGGLLPPQAGVVYRAAIDPAFSRDAFALGIAHMGRDERLIVDGVWTWHRAGFERTLDEVAEVAARYGVRTLRTDQFSSAAIVEGLGRRRLGCDAVPWDAGLKYQAYTRLKALINTHTIELPDDEGLRQELIGLEARPLPSGQTRIAARGSEHDDRASVLAALVDTLAGRRGAVTIFSMRSNTGSLGGRDFRFVGDRMQFAGERSPETVEVAGQVLRLDDPDYAKKYEALAIQEFMTDGLDLEEDW